MSVLLPDEEKTLVELLKKLTPGYYPYDIFIQFTRLVTTPIIEFVPLRLRGGRAEVLLIRRSYSDQLWPSKLHTPGAVIRPTDSDSKQYPTFQRIFKDELLGTVTGQPFYVGSNLHKSKRGTEQAQIYWVEVLQEPKVGEFYAVDDLPYDIIDSQIGFIKLAAMSFMKQKEQINTNVN